MSFFKNLLNLFRYPENLIDLTPDELIVSTRISKCLSFKRGNGCVEKEREAYGLLVICMVNVLGSFL